MSPPTAPARLTVGVLGAGRAGCLLGAALNRAGHRVTAVTAVSQASRDRVEEFLPHARVLPPAEVVADADLVLLTVPDEELPRLVMGLVDTGALRPGAFWLHASPRYGTAVLDRATSAGALPLALHPMLSLTGTSLDVTRLDGCPIAVTAPPALRPVAEALAVEMGGEPVWVPEEARPALHAALVLVGPHLRALVGEAWDVLRSAGIGRPERVLGPLVQAAADAAAADSGALLDGPVVRADADAVRSDLQALAAEGGTATAAYVALARLSADRALAQGVLRPDKAAALLDSLADRPGIRG